MYNFSDKDKNNDLVEERLKILKKEYHNHEMPVEEVEKMTKTLKQMTDTTSFKKRGMIKYATVAAALVAAMIILPNTSSTVAHAMGQIPVLGKLIEVVTFRDYQYESERHTANIEVPEITVDEVEESEQVNEVLNQTVKDINTEIQDITNEIVAQFETYLEDEQGYQDVMVKSEILATTDDYFTLKLLCYQGAGSGYQWNYYYTIDLTTGERLKLKDLFVEGADYITPISENIKEQMQAQMDADEMVHYWLHDEIEELNFKSITEDTSFYLNERGNIVIGFNEGDVAPMYMGTVEFEIPSDALKNIVSVQ